MGKGRARAQAVSKSGHLGSVRSQLVDRAVLPVQGTETHLDGVI